MAESSASSQVAEIEPVLRPPQPHQVHDLRMSDGAVIRLRRHGNPDGPRVAMSHGNGLAIESYYPFWRGFLEDYCVFLFDIRNHGQNPLHEPDAHTWPRFVLDFEEIYKAIGALYGSAPVAGIFHSLASVTAVEHTMRQGARWSPLILVDPPLFPPHGHPLEPDETEHMRDMARIARYRPELYATPDDFAALLRRRRAFSRWVAGAHQLFAETTLVPDPESGKWRLACPRELEARIYEGNISPDGWRGLADMPVPTFVIGADPDLPEALMPPKLARAVATEHQLPYVCMENTTHFLQIERPDDTVKAALSFIREAAEKG